MTDDKRRQIYDAMAANYDMPAFDQFSKDLEDPEKRKQLYDAMTQDYDMPSYEQFTSDMMDGYETPAAQTPASPAKPQKPAKPVKGQSAYAPNEQVNPFMPIGMTTMNQANNVGPVEPPQSMDEFQRDMDAKQRAITQRHRANQAQIERAAQRDGFHTGRNAVTMENGKFVDRQVAANGEIVADETARQQVDNMYSKPTILANEIDATDSEIARLQEKINARRAEIETQYANAGRTYYDRNAPLGSDPLQFAMGQDPELQMLTTAINSARDRKLVLDREQGAWGFWKTVLEDTKSFKPFMFGMDELGDAVNLAKYGEKQYEGKLGKAQEDMLRNTYKTGVATQKYSENDTWLQKGADTFVQAVPFVAEFFVTGGGLSAVTAAGERVGARVAAKVIGEAAEKTIKNRVASWTLRNAGVLAGDLASAFVMANTTGAARTASQVIEGTTGVIDKDANGNWVFTQKKGVGQSLYEAEMRQMLEYYTEKLGDHLPGTEAFSRLFGWLGAKGVSNALMRMSKSEWATFMREMGVSNFPSEVIEEEANLLLGAIIVPEDKDNRWKDVLNPQVHGDIVTNMLLSCAALQAPSMATGAYRTAQYYRYKHTNDKADAFAATMFGDRWDALKGRIDGTTNDGMGALIASIAADGTMNATEKGLAGEYIKSLIQMRGYNLGTMGEASKQQAAAEESQATGQTAEADVQAVVDNSLNDAYSRGYNADENEAAQIFADYQNANEAQYDYEEKQMAYQGMMQRLEDDLDLEASQQKMEIGRETHSDGSVHPATMRGEEEGSEDVQVYITDGYVATRTDGTIDANASDRTIAVYNPATGQVTMVPPSGELGLTSVGQATPASELVSFIDQQTQQKREAAIEAMRQAAAGVVPSNSDAQAQQPAASGWQTGAPEQLTPGMEVELGNNGMYSGPAVYTGQVVRNSDGTYTQDPNGNIAEFVGDGQAWHFATGELGNVVTGHNAGVEQAPVANAEQEMRAEQPAAETVQPAVVATVDKQPAVAPAEAGAITPEEEYKKLTEDGVMDSEEVAVLIDNNLFFAQDVLQRTMDAKPKPGTDMEEFKAAKMKWQDDVAVSQAAVDHWNAMKAIHEGKAQQAAEQQAKPAEGAEHSKQNAIEGAKGATELQPNAAEGATELHPNEAKGAKGADKLHPEGERGAKGLHQESAKSAISSQVPGAKQTQQSEKHEPGLVRNGKEKGLSNPVIVMLDNIGKAIGFRVEVTDSLRENENGMYSKGNRTIYVNRAKAEAMGSGFVVFAAGHEVTHAIRSASEELYQKYVDHVRKAMGEENFNAEFAKKRTVYDAHCEQLRQEGQNAKNLTDDELIEEIAADFAGRFVLGDRKVAEQILGDALNLGIDTRSVIRKILDAINKVLDSVKGMFAGEHMKEFEAARDMWLGLYQEAEAGAQKQQAEPAEGAERRKGSEQKTTTKKKAAKKTEKTSGKKEEDSFVSDDEEFFCKAEKKQKITKAKSKRKFDISEFASKYTDREGTWRSLLGVLREGGMKVSSDAHMIVAINADYPADEEGKVIVEKSVGEGKSKVEKGTVIKEKFPNWRLSIPKKDNATVTPMDTKDLKDFVASIRKTLNDQYEALKAEGKTGNTSKSDYMYEAAIAIRFSDGGVDVYKLDVLEKFSDAADAIGAKEIYHIGTKRVAWAESENGCALMMPAVFEGVYDKFGKKMGELENFMTFYEFPNTKFYYDMKGIANMSEAERTERDGTINAKYSIIHADDIAMASMDYFGTYYEGTGEKNPSRAPFSLKKQQAPITRGELEAGNAMISEMVDFMRPYLDATSNGKRILPEEVFGNGVSTIISNKSYGTTMENTTICLRTLSYNDFVDNVKKKLGRPLTQKESFLASQMVYDIAKDPQCLYCYVSLDRKAYDEFLLRYVNDRDVILEKYKSGKKFSGKGTPHEELADLYKEYLNGRKDTKNMKQRFDVWINTVDAGGKFVTNSDLTTQEVRSAIRSGLDKSMADQMKDIEAYARSASWAKANIDYRSYNGELLTLSKDKVDKLMGEYGLRFYSFSEYTPAFIVENMQMVRDAALRGMKGLSYTKETDFVKIFAPTGMNINCSVYGRRDASGNVVMDDRQGSNWDEVKSLRDKYKNVGAVFVAVDDEMVAWALEQDWIDIVIPFHIVRTGAEISDFYGWTNYSGEQADKTERGKAKYISPAKHHNDRETYLALCEEEGLTPRFLRFIVNPNYMKLVNETRQSVDETSQIKPVFNIEEAKRSFSEFVEKGGYYGGWWDVDERGYVDAVEQVASDIESGLTAKDVDYGRQDIPVDVDKMSAAARRRRQHGNSPVKYSLSAMDGEYMDAVKAGDMERAGRMVAEAAAKAMPNTKVVDGQGRPLVVYHGTNQGGFTEFNINETPKNEYRPVKHIGFFFTDNKEVAETYVDKNKKRPENPVRLDNHDKDSIDNLIAALDRFGVEVTYEKDSWYEDEYNVTYRYKDEEDEEGLTESTKDVYRYLLEFYNTYNKQAHVYPVFLNIVNPSNMKKFVMMRETLEEVKNARETNDGVVINVTDNGPHGYIEDPSNVYVAFSPNQIKSAEPVVYDNDGNVIPLSKRFDMGNSDIRYSVDDEAGYNGINGVEDGKYQYSLVEDPAEVARLDGDVYGKKVYRAMVVGEDGGIEAPMSNNGLTNPGKGTRKTGKDIMGSWGKSEENPDLITEVDKNGVGHLHIKDDAGGRTRVAYNPYFHTSLTMLNDQFKKAWRRPNMVVVECQVPAGEMTVGDAGRAKYAKDAPGEMKWKDGPVSRTLKIEPRSVILSRWVKPVRIVPMEEYAQSVKELLEANGVLADGIPFNCVTPQQRDALAAAGVTIAEPAETKHEECWEAYREWKRGNAKDGVKYRDGDNEERIPYEKRVASARKAGFTKAQYDAHIVRAWNNMRTQGQALVDKLGLTDKIEIVDTTSETGKKGRAKGWYDEKTGKITIVMFNNGGAEDICKTILHEAVGHYGLRQLFGDRFDTFLDNVYNNYNEYDYDTWTSEKEKISKMAQEKGISIREATEEYLARMAEETDFEGHRNGFWAKIRTAFLDMMDKLGLRSFNLGSINEGELKYILWRSYKNLTEPGRYINRFKGEDDVEMRKSNGVAPAYAEGGSYVADSGMEASTQWGANDVRYSVTDTYNFKKWFNGSKVVDEQGQPKVVYHGTPWGLFDSFDNFPAFFTDNMKSAEFFAEGQGRYEEGADDVKHRVYKTYLSMSNPYVIDCKGEDWTEAEMPTEDCDRFGIYYRKTSGQNAIVSSDDIAGSAINEYHDGVIIKNQKGNGSGEELQTEYIVFDPVQVMMAEDENVRYSVSDIEDEFMRALYSGDMDKLRGMVKESAKESRVNRGTYDLNDNDNLVTSNVKSKEFIKWFGDSKVVDKNGDPLVVYHGSSDSGLSVISRGFFTSSGDVAKTYAGKTYGKVYPVFLSIKQPIEINGENADVEGWNKIWMTNENAAKYGITETSHLYDGDDVMAEAISDYNEDTGKEWIVTTADDIVDAMRKLDEYDGVIIRNVYGDSADESINVSHDEFIPKRPSQIKSVYNVGTFDAGNDDMRYSVTGQDEISEYIKRKPNENYGGEFTGKYSYYGPAPKNEAQRQILDYVMRCINRYEYEPSEAIGYSYNQISDNPEEVPLWTNEDVDVFNKHMFLDEEDVADLNKTRSPKFKKWFGDWEKDPEHASKVVKKDGSPKVVYHGSKVFKKDRFNTFNSESGMYFFTDSGMTAEDYAFADNDYEGQGVVYEVFLNMRNPLVIDADGSWWADIKTDDENLDEVKISGERYTTNNIARYVNEHPELGYDGVIVKDVEDGYVHSNFITDYIVFSPSQIKSANENNGDYDPNNPDIRYSLDYVPVFVSNAARALEGIKQEKATPEQWLAMLTKAGGIKAGEDKWMGLSDWLKERAKDGAKSLTKNEVMDFVKKNNIKVVDVKYSNYEFIRASFIEDVDERVQALFDSYVEESMNENDDDIYMGNHYDYAQRKVEDDLSLGFGDNTVDFDGNEVSVNRHASDEEIIQVARNLGIDIPSELEDEDVNDIDDTRLRYTTGLLSNYYEIALVVPTIEPYNANDYTHFGDAGDGRAVAWVRFGETTDADGKRVLVIDEVQSKRHQDGREKGYGKTEKQYIAEEKAFHKKMADKYGLKLINGYAFGLDKYMNDGERARLSEVEAYRGGKHDFVPDAPFDKNWHEVAMKRMLRYAAENGYDKVAWTKGAQQADRYDIGGVVEKIYADHDNYDGEPHKYVDIKIKGSQRGLTFTVDKNGVIEPGNSDVTRTEYDGRKLSDVVGKEIADKIVNLPQEEHDIEFGEQDLRLGGEGMKGFYDKMLPAFMNKYCKKWGTQVGEVTLPNVEEAGRTMWAVDVTPEMRESVLGDGQVMFSLSDGKIQQAAAFNGSKRKAVSYAAGKLNTSVRVVENVDEIKDGNSVRQAKMRQARGWYDLATGEVVVVLPNNASVSDAVATVAHEVIGHKGLRELVGAENFDAFLDEVYDHLRGDLKAQVDDETGRRFLSDPTVPYEECRRVRMDELFAKLAETEYRDLSKDEKDLWQRLRNIVHNMLDKLMGGEKLPAWFSIGDNEMRYMLWRSKERLERGKESPLQMAQDITMRRELGIDKIDGDDTDPDGPGNGGGRPYLADRPGAGDKYSVTETPEFKRWFGDSKVVDGQGRPLVVYHGSEKTFTTFDGSAKHANNEFVPDGAIFFNSNRATANSYSTNDGYVDFSGGQKEGGIYGVYLKIENPLVVDFKGSNFDGTKYQYVLSTWNDDKDHFFDTEKARKTFDEKLVKDNPKVERSWREGFFEQMDHDVNWYVSKAMREGYDGLIINNVIDVGSNYVEGSAAVGTDYVVFNSNQIKSVDNVGTFDPENDDMRYSVEDTRLWSKDEIEDKMNAIVDELEARGFSNVFTSKSTSHGNSYYIKVFNGDFSRELAKIRLSDHSVTSNRRVLDEYHVYKHSDPVKVVDEIFGNNTGDKYSVDGTPRVAARAEYDRMVSDAGNQFKEAMKDSMNSLKNLYQSVLGKGTKMKDIPDHENAYLAENRMQSMSAAQTNAWEHDFFQPIIKVVSQLTNKGNRKEREEAYNMLTDYMMAKHGLERNEVMAMRDARKASEENFNQDLIEAQYAVDQNPGDEKFEEKLNEIKAKMFDYQQAQYKENRKRDYSGLTALTGEKKIEDAESSAKGIVEGYEREHEGDGLVDKLWDSVNRATRNSLFKIFSCGMMDYKRYQQVLDMFEYYIPLQGFDENVAEDEYAYMGSDGTLGYGTPIRAAKGRKSKADDPIATIMMNGAAAIRQGNRNLMKQRFLNFVQAHPSDLVSVQQVWLKKNDVTGEWEQYFDADLQETDSPDVVEQKVKDFDDKMVQLASQDPDHYMRHTDSENIPFRVINPRDMKQHQVLIRRNGKPFVVIINGNPRAAQALNGLSNPDNNTTGAFATVLGWMKNTLGILSRNYTTRNPAFILSNFMRDALYSNTQVHVKEGSNYAFRFNANFMKLAPVVPVSMGVLYSEWQSGELMKKAQMLRNSGDLSQMDQWRVYFEEFMSNGGETGYTNLKDIEQQKRDIDKMLRRERNTSAKAWKALGGVFDLMNSSVENTARFAAYVTSRELGRSVGRAIYDAKEISVNFNKKGAGDRYLGAKNETALGNVTSFTGGLARGLYVFWNASVQGLDNILGNAKQNPLRAGAMYTSLFLLGAFLPKVVEAVAGGDDDDDKDAYYNLPEYVRRSNICFRWSKDMPWITIPLPVEYRAIYGLGELSMGVIDGKERYDADELTKQYISQVSQVLPLDFMEGGGGLHAFIPSYAKPLVEVQGNHSWSGLPIYRDDYFKKNDPNWTLAFDNTSKPIMEATKWLNEKTGGSDVTKGVIDINPAKVEYLLRGYIGGPYTMFNQLVKTGETIAGEREFDWKSIPIADRLIKTGDERTETKKTRNRYFSLLEEHEKTKHDYKKLKEQAESGREDALAYAERVDALEHSKEYGRYFIMDSYKSIMDKLNAMKKEATSDEERERIEQQKSACMRECVTMVNAYDDGKIDDVAEQLRQELLSQMSAPETMPAMKEKIRAEHDKVAVKRYKGEAPKAE